MPLSLSTFSSTDTLDAASMTALIDDIEAYINGGVVTADLGSGSPGQFVDTEHLFRPEFYGAPHERAVMHSGDTIVRHMPDDRFSWTSLHADISTDEWMPVPWLCATWMSTLGPNSSGAGINAEFMASWTTWEFGGGLAISGASYSNYERYPAAKYVLCVNGVEVADTARWTLAGTTTPALFRRKTHTIQKWLSSAALGGAPGILSAGIYVRVEPPFSAGDWLHIITSNRNLVIAGHTHGA